MLLKQCLRLNRKINSKFGLATYINVKHKSDDGKMKSWQVHSYGGLDELQLSNSRRPVIREPDDVIVQVRATSINPIDVAMMSGYGSVLLNFMRQAKSCSIEPILEFPLTLGRDFSGVVVQKGHGVKDEFSVGDEVWGVVPIQDQGCHAEEVLVSKNCIKKKPSNISMVEAGSMLYGAVTAWSALKITGSLALFPITGRDVLVLGGSGGVGTMAVQMLQSWGAHVVATCSSDAVPLLQSLGVIDIIDYKENDSFEKMEKFKYDIILDCAGIGQDNARRYVHYLKDYQCSKFITLKSPMVNNIDEYGMIAGMAKNAADLMFVNFNTGVLPKTSSIRWGFFMPLETALTEITSEVAAGKILPCVQKVYKFAEFPEAYQHVQAGHLRGKIAVDMTSR